MYDLSLDSYALPAQEGLLGNLSFGVKDREFRLLFLEEQGDTSSKFNPNISSEIGRFLFVLLLDSIGRHLGFKKGTFWESQEVSRRWGSRRKLGTEALCSDDGESCCS